MQEKAEITQLLFATAKELLVQLQPVIEGLAEKLAQTGTLSGKRVMKILDSVPIAFDPAPDIIIQEFYNKIQKYLESSK